MRRIYGTMSWRHRNIGYRLCYPAKLNKLEETIDKNSVITQQISQMNGTEDAPRLYLSQGQKGQSIEQIREVLKQIVREWSIEGADERAQTFGPILETLMAISEEKRHEYSVLIPGAGLGRLAWEIANLGFNAISNEISPYMNLTLRFLVSRSKTYKSNQHVVHPYAYWFSHQPSNSAMFRGISFPDVIPSLFPESRLKHEELDFLELSPISGGYDYIITHYFIDTSLNIITTLEKIHSLLKPGGTWINLGPLLWLNTRATMELSLEEVLELSTIIGFDVKHKTRRTVPSEYTRDKTCMMSWIYKAEFWIAKKR
ncbi:hypothetical protein M422DRAFT_158191 [Sphaerobolus stellatus SS14]|nr:hypothetical protein M422DRAFT_158191 [Sphaerobolus stellatus SS14]